MAEIPATTSKTVAAIYESYEKAAERRWQRRLGASQAGHECDRFLWYSFRWWAEPEKFDGRMLRLFETGHRAEPRFADDLEGIGVEVHLVNQETGEQFELTALDGHLVCKMDGAAIGVPEAPKEWHVCEFKTHNAKSYSTIQRDGIKKAKPQHYYQCVLGMMMSGMKRCLYVAENKDTSELYSERLRWEECADDAAKIMVRLKGITSNSSIPKRISTNPESKQCKYCTFKGVCHEGGTPPVTCRSCVFSRAIHGGQWYCGKYRSAIDHEAQLLAHECPSYELNIGISPSDRAIADKECSPADGIEGHAVVLHLPNGRPYKAVPLNEYVAAV